MGCPGMTGKNLFVKTSWAVRLSTRWRVTSCLTGCFFLLSQYLRLCALHMLTNNILVHRHRKVGSSILHPNPQCARLITLNQQTRSTPVSWPLTCYPSITVNSITLQVSGAHYWPQRNCIRQYQEKVGETPSPAFTDLNVSKKVVPNLSDSLNCHRAMEPLLTERVVLLGGPLIPDTGAQISPLVVYVQEE